MKAVIAGFLMVAIGTAVPLLAQQAVSPAPAQSQTAPAAHSATKPIAMKPISAAEESSYTTALQGRAESVLDDLKLTNDDKVDHVKKAVIAQYRTLRAWHDTYDDDLKALNKDANANKASIAQITQTMTDLHAAFLKKLAEDLTDPQIEVVKDRMTYGTVKVTYDEYLKENPTLADPQKTIILATLKEARELAMDDGSQSEKAATFKKFKGRINNQLATWKKEAATSTAPASAPTVK